MGSTGRPRREETDRSIHRAALSLLREGGPAAVTVEGVSAASRVAKTTIYRRYTDREEVLRAALASAIGTPGEPAGSTPREKVRWALRELWSQMSDVLGPGGIAAALGGSDPRFAAMLRDVLTPYHSALVERVAEDVAEGVLRADLDPDTAVSVLTGAYLGELLRNGSVTDDFLGRCVDLMWVAMVAHPSKSS